MLRLIWQVALLSVVVGWPSLRQPAQLRMIEPRELLHRGRPDSPDRLACLSWLMSDSGVGRRGGGRLT